jgi:hypothetical protein
VTGQAVRASRTRKCRYQHRCALCRGYVLTGQSEGLVTGAGWAHVDCIVDGQRQAQG